MIELKPVQNVRRVRPARVCTFCKFLASEDGTMQCTRPNGPNFDTGDRLYDVTTCDRWAGHEYNRKRKVKALLMHRVG